MARDGYVILDSDLHMMEPDNLWARYLEEPHRTPDGMARSLNDFSTSQRGIREP